MFFQTFKVNPLLTELSIFCPKRRVEKKTIGYCIADHFKANSPELYQIVEIQPQFLVWISYLYRMVIKVEFQTRIGEEVLKRGWHGACGRRRLPARSIRTRIQDDLFGIVDILRGRAAFPVRKQLNARQRAVFFHQLQIPSLRLPDDSKLSTYPAFARAYPF